MTFNNPIVAGGGALALTSVHSPQYQAGVSGWSINKDGTAEFSALTVRGKIVVQSSSQGIFVYNGTPAAGNLLATIAAIAGTDPFGNQYLSGIISYSVTTTVNVQMDRGQVVFNDVTFTIPPAILAIPDSTAAGTPTTSMRSPSNRTVGNAAYSQISLNGESQDGTVQPSIALTGFRSGAEIATPTRVNGKLTVTGDLQAPTGILSAGNIVAGQVTITPSAANTPTSLVVTFIPTLKGTNFFAQVAAKTTAPGTVVTGVSFTSLSATGVTIWLTRTNIVATDIHYFVFGV